jgi:hypothetical protein
LRRLANGQALSESVALVIFVWRARKIHHSQLRTGDKWGRHLLLDIDTASQAASAGLTALAEWQGHSRDHASRKATALATARALHTAGRRREAQVEARQIRARNRYHRSGCMPLSSQCRFQLGIPQGYRQNGGGSRSCAKQRRGQPSAAVRAKRVFSRLWPHRVMGRRRARQERGRRTGKSRPRRKGLSGRWGTIFAPLRPHERPQCTLW